MLGGFGFQFSGGADEGQPGDVDIKTVLAADVAPHLAQGFQERQAFNITHCAAHLNQHNFRPGGFRHFADAAFNDIGDMRDDLDGAAQVVAPPFAGDDFFVNLACGNVADLVEAGVNETFVVAQVQVGFSAIVQHINLAVLIGAHCARIDVDVGIQLLDRN